MVARLCPPSDQDLSVVLEAFGAARRSGAVEVCFTPGGQRLGDDGDAWRCLLFGAPPSAA